MSQYIEPAPKAPAYTCPHCGTLAEVRRDYWTREAGTNGPPEWHGTRCRVCGGWIAWFKDERRWPSSFIGPLAHEKMPANVREIYDEAREVGGRSPRSAGALLRLGLQVLVSELVTEPNLNKAIGDLVKDGLPERIQKAMDVLRVVGNNAVHPGEIVLDEQPETVQALFQLLNLVVEDRIARIQEIDALYEALPAGALEAIDRRDGTTPVTTP